MSESTIPEEEIREAWNAHTHFPNVDSKTWEKAIRQSGFIYLAQEADHRAQDFRWGYLAHAAKHAEEVGKRDAEIERLTKMVEEKESMILHLIETKGGN